MKRLAFTFLALILFVQASFAQDALNVDALKKRADTGDRTATRTLAEAYYAGSGGVVQDFALAARYFQRLSEMGDVRAMTTLGLMYARGIGVPKDIPTAVKKWEWAASQARPDSGAAYNMGIAYMRGEGIPENTALGLKWLTRAAEWGHVLAQHDVGLIYLLGNGTARDEVQGAAWLIVAAQRGDASAQERLKEYASQLPAETLDQAHKRAAQWLKRPDANR